MLKKFIRPRLRRISRTLSAYKLNRPTFNRSIDDLDETRFLGYYTEYGLNYALYKYGLLDELNKRGFHKVRLKLFPTEFNEGKLFVYSESPKLNDPLIELVLKTYHFSPAELVKFNRHDLADKNFLKIEWLALQDPLLKSDPLFPGQKYPGLGLGRFAYELILIIKWRLKLDGLINVPNYYHNAIMYASEFEFIDPGFNAHFERIQREFRYLSVFDISWRIENKSLFFDDGNRVEWNPNYQLRYHSKK